MKRPIYDTVTEYSRKAGYPWHMPGNKRGKGFSSEEEADKMLSQEAGAELAPWKDMFCMDFTEIPGLDEYHDPEGIIKEAQEQAARIYGTKDSFFLVNGSTAGILAAISAVCHRSDEILVARNCHKSVYHAIELRGLTPVYLFPEWLGDWDIYGGVSLEQTERLLKEHPKARVVVVTSPTYEGVVSDIEGLARIVHDYGGILIVDEAHGAHLPFMSQRALKSDGQSDICGGNESHNAWVPSAISCGADLVIQSLHKTLPALTQCAIVHRCSDRVSREGLFHYVSLFQTTSPSYILMASMDHAVHVMAESGQWIKAYEDELKCVRERLSGLGNIRLLEQKDLDGSCAVGYDNAKLVLSVKHTGRTGAWLTKELARYGHVMEMHGMSYSLAMTSVMDSREAFTALAEALEQIDSRIDCGDSLPDDMESGEEYDRPAGDIRKSDKTDDISIREFTAEKQPEQVLRVEEALSAPSVWIPLEQAAGQIAADYVYAYPPGSPILVPGERIREDLLYNIRQAIEAGLNMKGIKNNGTIHHDGGPGWCGKVHTDYFIKGVLRE